MRLGVAALGIVVALAGSPAGAQESACGRAVRLSVEPASRTDEVAATLRRRLEAAGAVAPKVQAEGPGALRAVLPQEASESLLTRPARIEFRLVAKPEEAGAIAMRRLDGQGSESVSPEIILDETHLREVRVKTVANAAGGPPDAVLAFHFDPYAVKNLMAASTEAIGRKLAILVDDQVVADPIIRAPIASMTGEIPAGALGWASELVDLLRNGRLTARVAVTGREPAPCGTR